MSIAKASRMLAFYAPELTSVRKLGQSQSTNDGKTIYHFEYQNSADVKLEYDPESKQFELI